MYRAVDAVDAVDAVVKLCRMIRTPNVPPKDKLTKKLWSSFRPEKIQ